MATDDVPPMEDYDMRGRTYRYAEKTPLYPFGFGLSYVEFEYGNLQMPDGALEVGEMALVSAEVTNQGARPAEEVVQLYVHDDEASVRTPNWQLSGIERVKLQPGETATVEFEITPRMLDLVNKEGERVLEPGTFTISIGGSLPTDRSRELGAPAPVTGTLVVEG
jgi:beta-glucosidase